MYCAVQVQYNSEYCIDWSTEQIAEWGAQERHVVERHEAARGHAVALVQRHVRDAEREVLRRHRQARRVQQRRAHEHEADVREQHAHANHPQETCGSSAWEKVLR